MKNKKWLWLLLIAAIFIVIFLFLHNLKNIPQEEVDAKPVIYLYPEKETAVDVSLDYKGELTCTYPEYDGGWSVIAKPDGTIFDKDEKE